MLWGDAETLTQCWLPKNTGIPYNYNTVFKNDARDVFYLFGYGLRLVGDLILDFVLSNCLCSALL